MAHRRGKRSGGTRTRTPRRRGGMNRREFVALAAGCTARPARDHRRSLPLESLVTCDAESRLAVVDLGVVPGRCLAADAARSASDRTRRRTSPFVCHTAVGAVSIVEPRMACGTCCVDSSSRGTSRRTPTAGMRSSPTPAEAASSRSTSRRGGSLGRVTAAGLGASHHDRRGRRPAVGRARSASTHVAVVDTRRLRHVATLTPGFGAHDVGLAPDGRLWVTAGASRELAIAGDACRPPTRRRSTSPSARGRAFVTSGDCGRPARAGARRAGAPFDADPRRARTTSSTAPGRVITAVARPGTLTMLDRARRPARARARSPSRATTPVSGPPDELYGSLTASQVDPFRRRGT